MMARVFVVETLSVLRYPLFLKFTIKDCDECWINEGLRVQRLGFRRLEFRRLDGLEFRSLDGLRKHGLHDELDIICC